MTLTSVDLQGVRLIDVSLVSLDAVKRGPWKSVKRAGGTDCQTGFPPQDQHCLQPSLRTAGQRHILTQWPAKINDPYLPCSHLIRIFDPSKLVVVSLKCPVDTPSWTARTTLNKDLLNLITHLEELISHRDFFEQTTVLRYITRKNHHKSKTHLEKYHQQK